MNTLEITATLILARKYWMSNREMAKILGLWVWQVSRLFNNKIVNPRKTTIAWMEKLKTHVMWLRTYEWLEQPAKQMVDKLKTTVEEREAPELEKEVWFIWWGCMEYISSKKTSQVNWVASTEQEAVKAVKEKYWLVNDWWKSFGVGVLVWFVFIMWYRIVIALSS